VQVRLDTEFQLALGQVAELEGAELRIEFEAVPEDSRCPPYAFCFWAGDALVELEVWEAGTPEWRRRDLALHTNPSIGPAQAAYDIYALQLLELEPGFGSPATLCSCWSWSPASVRRRIRPMWSRCGSSN
jgi:hypothetical protein